MSSSVTPLSPSKRLLRPWRLFGAAVRRSSPGLTALRETASAVTNARRSIAVRVENLGQNFGHYPALRDVTLDIAPGELVALLGPSGSGKTTLLRVIAGLNTPDCGRVLFNGEDATRLSVQERRVGFVFQSYALFKHMTVAENVAFGLKSRPRRARPSHEAITSRVRELLAYVQLDGLEERYPAQLSGGQRQRVAFARALAIEPRLLLLDEPFGALDARVRKDLRRWLRHIHRETGLTTVFVTHDQDEAMELADRVVVLNQGRIEQAGTPAELYDRPASPFVISFVGEAVALPVQVKAGHVIFGRREIHVDPSGLRDGPARVYFRPADIAIASNGSGELEGRVENLRRTPAGVRATIALEGFDQTIEIDSSVEAARALGDTVPLSLSKARIFPGDGGGAGEFRDAGAGI